MNLHTHATEDHSDVIGHIGWKYYNTIKKKAMEQEFSWSGLIISLSIAFFIVISAAIVLNLAYESVTKAEISQKLYSDNFYRLEVTPEKTYLNTKHINEKRLILVKKTESV